MAVGRFQVMAVLQAARAYVLGLPEESAKSWGLNRAIFYAAAKRGFKERPLRFEDIVVPARREDEAKLKEMRESFGVFHLGDEMAYSVKIDGKQFFTIGNEVQTPEKFQKQVESRFKGLADKIWQEAVEICKQFDKGVLLSQRYFYETVYKPKRDELAQKWTKLVESHIGS